MTSINDDPYLTAVLVKCVWKLMFVMCCLWEKPCMFTWLVLYNVSMTAVYIMDLSKSSLWLAFGWPALRWQAKLKLTPTMLQHGMCVRPRCAVAVHVDLPKHPLYTCFLVCRFSSAIFCNFCFVFEFRCHGWIHQVNNHPTKKSVWPVFWLFVDHLWATISDKIVFQLEWHF